MVETAVDIELSGRQGGGRKGGRQKWLKKKEW